MKLWNTIHNSESQRLAQRVAKLEEKLFEVMERNSQLKEEIARLREDNARLQQQLAAARKFLRDVARVTISRGYLAKLIAKVSRS